MNQTENKAFKPQEKLATTFREYVTERLDELFAYFAQDTEVCRRCPCYTDCLNLLDDNIILPFENCVAAVKKILDTPIEADPEFLKYINDMLEV